jgi:ABC-type nitrate/sulfonate/bicarbonate transport system substrate-binding protein
MKRVSLVTILIVLIPAFSAHTISQKPVVIYAPVTPSSIPVIIATQNMNNTEIKIFSNHSQAHTLFLRDDIPILTTGLSIGVNFFKNGIPVQTINSYVTGLTYLVTYHKKVSNFNELRDQHIYLPFEGSPIEEMTRFLVEQEGLIWKKHLTPVYTPFPSSVELLKIGKVRSVALPEPFVSLVEQHSEVFVSFAYKEKWDSVTGTGDGYPQVGTFVKTYWAEQHREFILMLNKEIKNAIQLIKQDPERAIFLTKDYFNFPQKILTAALGRTSFSLKDSYHLKQDISQYYHILGKPLDETFHAFFYLYQK